MLNKFINLFIVAKILVFVGDYISIPCLGHPVAIPNLVWQLGTNATNATTKNGAHLAMLLPKSNCVQPKPMIIYKYHHVISI